MIVGRLHPYLDVLSRNGSLTRSQAADAMHIMLGGDAEPEQLAAFLLGLRARGESVDELVGFTEAMRTHATRVDADPDAIDLCGTGGDSSGTFNISTAASLVAAGAGATVAKHGNRSVSSKAGSADVLEALGVAVDLAKEGAEYCLDKAGIAFLFAPYFHPAMRFVMPVRRALGVRTLFNILGPLCNPAGVRRQLVGAFDLSTAKTMASILHTLDAEQVVAVHAEDGLDEISLTSASAIFDFDRRERLASGGIPDGRTIRPEDHGMGRSTADALRGGTAEQNAAIIVGILAGDESPARDVVVLNAGYALSTTGRYASVDEAIEAAKESIDSGKARLKLRALIEASNRAPKA
ncbi:MAG: anthranilate phosphoribosyltransferase [Bacteroidota bacterium]